MSVSTQRRRRRWWKNLHLNAPFRMLAIGFWLMVAGFQPAFRFEHICIRCERKKTKKKLKSKNGNQSYAHQWQTVNGDGFLIALAIVIRTQAIPTAGIHCIFTCLVYSAWACSLTTAVCNCIPINTIRWSNVDLLRVQCKVGLIWLHYANQM